MVRCDGVTKLGGKQTKGSKNIYAWWR